MMLCMFKLTQHLVFMWFTVAEAMIGWSQLKAPEYWDVPSANAVTVHLPLSKHLNTTFSMTCRIAISCHKLSWVATSCQKLKIRKDFVIAFRKKYVLCLVNLAFHQCQQKKIKNEKALDGLAWL